MKKRVLSLLLACLMVASTFIISKPLVHVHAIDGEEATEWALPLDFKWGDNITKDSKGWPINGNFRLRAYAYKNETQIDYNTVLVTSKSNRTGGTESKGTWWYMADIQGDGELINKYDASKAGVRVNPCQAAAAIVFTAPKEGVYEFNEVVRQETFVTAANDNGNPISDTTVEWSVVKDGVVLTTFRADPEAKTGTLNGRVTLKEGEELIFVAGWTSVYKFSWSEDWNVGYCNAFIDSLVVKMAADVNDSNYKAEVDLTPKFEIGKYTDKLGNVTLKGYNKVTKEFYDVAKWENAPDYSAWVAYDNIPSNIYNSNFGGAPKGYNMLWCISNDGEIVHVGGAQKTTDTGSALVFKAPNDGTFYLYAELGTTWSENKNFHDSIIMDQSGNVLVSESNEGKGNKYVTKISHTVSLKKGEEVYILKLPTEGSTNDSCDGVAKIVITELDHVCSAYTVKKVSAVIPSCSDGITQHYACYCGNTFADAAALDKLETVVDPATDSHKDPEVFSQSATEHWKICANNCGSEFLREAHSWEDGVCEICDYECKHDDANAATCNKASFCSICNKVIAPKDPSNHSDKNGTYVNTGKGTHRYNRICCDATDIAEEKCIYGTDNICDKCGYDNSKIDAAESNKNDAFENAFKGGNNSVTVVGSQDGELDDYAVNGSVIEGAEYKLFNIHFDDSGKMYLRHHFIIDNNAKVYLNGVEQALINVEGTNIYYFDVTPKAGEYHIADAIAVNNGKTEETYEVSLYSYLKIALDENNVGELSPAKIDLLKSLYDLNEASKEEKMVLVGMANQTTKQVEIYDIATGNMNTPIWKYRTTCGNISGFKLRSFAPYGDVVLITDGTKAEMVSFDTKQIIWSTTNAPTNSHSIELLPNGVIAVAGAAPGSLVYFFNINDEDPAEYDAVIELGDAHGVLWDPEYEVIWTLGRTHLWAYNVTLEADGSVSVKKNDDLSAEMPDDHGHDLQPVYENSDCLIVSAWKHVYIYNKVTKTFEELISENSVKGIGTFENGDFIYMFYDGGDDNGKGGGWNTTYITYVTANGEAYQIHSDQGRFYKCRVWDANYQ